MDFQVAFRKLLDNEGYTLTDDKNDPGGLTKFGISHAAYPDIDINSLTLNQASEIYLRDWWNPLRCDSLPDQVAFALFDAAVNSGAVTAIRWLQGALNVTVDGHIGPITIGAAREQNPAKVVARMTGARLDYMTRLPGWTSFGKGWARRIANNLQEI